MPPRGTGHRQAVSRRPYRASDLAVDSAGPFFWNSPVRLGSFLQIALVDLRG